MAAESRTTGDLAVFDTATAPKKAYRILAVAGTVLVTAVALAIAAGGLWKMPIGPAPGGAGRFGTGPRGGAITLALMGLITLLATLPLWKPEPRRILDTLTKTVRSLLLVVAVFATVGYFTHGYGPSRSLLATYAGVLALGFAPLFVALQEGLLKRTEGTLIVGNNPERIEAAVQAAAEPIVGYAFSPTDHRGPEGNLIGTDGGQTRMPPKLAQFECLGGLSRLDDILDRTNVGTVIPALPQTDRAEFFGVLETCHDHDVNVEILNEHNESVLVEDETASRSERTQRLIGINMEPLDLQNRVVKRLFDVVFAAVGLLVTAPLIVLIAAAIKLDSRGSILYTQQRTTQFGDTFPVYKFRTMRPASEAAAPGTDGDRITRVGRILRPTHLDEIPQLWAILTGKMSVVGPRAAWTAEEELLQAEMRTWKKRWFVKPGLTGLAQINDVSSENSRAKLQYDLTYIRNQSFWFDLKIIVRQLWMVCRDVFGLLGRGR